MTKKNSKNFANQFQNFVEYMTNFQFFEGEPKIQIRHTINAFKGGMFPMCIFFLVYFQNFSLPAILITILHGSYGVIWVLKDFIFGDKSFQIPGSLLGNLNVAIILFGYSSMAYTIISNPSYTQISIDRAMTACFLYIFGVVLMIAADAQKTFTLSIKKGLIDNGLFYNTRNPNYLGEIALYFAFGVLAQSTFCYSFLFTMWGLLFRSNMIMKDQSLSKKEGWKEYSQRSYILLPKLFSQGSIIYSRIFLFQTSK